MKIFYYSHDRCDTPLIASYIHLNKFSLHHIPTVKEFLDVYHSSKIVPDASGVPYFLGKDEDQNEIYVVGFGKNSKLALQAIANTNPNEPGWKFYNTFQERNFVIGLGSFVLSYLKLADLGIKITALGAQKSYLQVVKLVKTIKGLNPVD